MTPSRILIIKPSSLGDVATTLPMLCNLRRAYPAAKIDWLIHPSLTALVEGHDAINELIPFDRKRLAAWWYKPAALALFRQLLSRLRSAHYDLVLDAQGLFRSGFFARYTRAKTRIGFATAREGATLFYTHNVPLENGGKKMIAVDRMRALLAPLNIDTKRPAEFRLPIDPAARDRAAQLLPPTARFAAIIPGARWDTKRWSIEGFTEIARRLPSLGLTPLLLGSPDEKPLCDAIVSSVQLPVSRSEVPSVAPTGNWPLDTGHSSDTGHFPLNLAGLTSLAEMIALLARCSLVIGNDSGPLHVAVALGRPCVAIYGPTDPAYVGPYGQLENVVRFAVDCHPCRRKTCDHHSCMRGVTVEAVWQKTQQLSRTPTQA